MFLKSRLNWIKNGIIKMAAEKLNKYDLRQRRLNTIMQRMFYQCWQNALEECKDNSLAFSRAVSETAALYQESNKDQCTIAICYHRLTMLSREYKRSRDKYRVAVNIMRYARLIIQLRPSTASAIREYVKQVRKYLAVNYPEFDISRYLK